MSVYLESNWLKIGDAVAIDLDNLAGAESLLQQLWMICGLPGVTAEQIGEAIEIADMYLELDCLAD